MAIEKRRGCGFRKVGGLYLVGERLDGMACCKLPIRLHVCPTCNSGIKQTRGWQWLDPGPWLAGPCARGMPEAAICPAADPARLGDRVGLLWVGAKFYPTPHDFMIEAQELGPSRRIKAVPRGFKAGETWVFLAHPKVNRIIDDEGKEHWEGGVFRIFKPSRIEKIITQSQSEDIDAMADLEALGITPVIVPDNDRDHQGTVYDDGDGTLEIPVPADIDARAGL